MKMKPPKKEYAGMSDFKSYSNAIPHIPAYLTLESVYCAHATEKTVHIHLNPPTPGAPLYGIYLNLKGNGYIQKRDGKIHKLSEGDIHFTTNQNVKRVYSGSPNWDYLVYFFYTDTIEIPTEKTFNLSIDAEDEKTFNSRLIRLTQLNDPKNIQQANALLCARLFSWLNATRPADERKKEEILDKIIAYINEHVYEPLHVKDIAAALNLNVKYIQRLFIDKVGKTPKDYIMEIKARMVYGLLRADNLAIQDIAKICSFANSSHLVNSFKKIEGISPAQYRKRYKEELKNLKK